MILYLQHGVSIGQVQSGGTGGGVSYRKRFSRE